jgi:hypothetical protein
MSKKTKSIIFGIFGYLCISFSILVWPFILRYVGLAFGGCCLQSIIIFFIGIILLWLSYKEIKIDRKKKKLFFTILITFMILMIPLGYVIYQLRAPEYTFEYRISLNPDNNNNNNNVQYTIFAPLPTEKGNIIIKESDLKETGEVEFYFNNSEFGEVLIIEAIGSVSIDFVTKYKNHPDKYIIDSFTTSVLNESSRGEDVMIYLESPDSNFTIHIDYLALISHEGVGLTSDGHEYKGELKEGWQIIELDKEEEHTD